ncbi:MAG: tetratricopeptide repeat protein [Burkholderiales bacterium]
MSATFTPRPDPFLERMLQQAVKLHQHGGLARAELLYRRVLSEQPNHPHALFLLGNIALAAGKAAEAEGMLSRAMMLAPGDVEYAICLGNAQAVQGRYAAAAVHYRHALRLQPGSLGARFNLANALRDDGRLDDALAEYREVIRREPRHGPALNNLVNVLQERGAADEALKELAHYLRIAPGDARAHYNRGNLLRDRGETEAAMAAFRAAVRADPRFADAHNNLAVLLLQNGRADEALAHFGRTLELDPTQREALLNLSHIHIRLDEPALAVRYLRRFVALEPDHHQGRLMLALQYLAMRRLGDARDEFRVLVEAAPGDARMRVNYGTVLQELGELGPAIEQLEEALRADSSLLEGARYNLAIALRRDERPEEALPHLEAAVEGNPGSARLANALANVMLDLNRHDDAIREYRRAISLDPGLADVHVNLSGALVATGRFGEGWDADLARWRLPENIGRLLEYPQRAWSGEPLAGKRILVWTEQAPGDQIMFLHALPDLLARAGSVVLECSGRLLPLLQRSFPGVEMHPRFREQEQIPRLREHDIDYQAPMSELLRQFRRSWADFAPHAGYLRADPVKVARWRDRLAELGPGLKVGISWRGGTAETHRRRRSIPLRQWAPLLRTPGARFVSLQYSNVLPELAELREQEGLDLPHWQEAIDDFDQTAGLLAALDLVISVPTTAIHLAGALAVPTWVLTPHRAGFRYLREGRVMPWYPSVTLHRQPDPASWDGLFDEICGALRTRIGGAVAAPRA